MSIGVIALFVSSILNSKLQNDTKVYFAPFPFIAFIVNTIKHPHFKKAWQNFNANATFLLSSLLFWVALISLIYSRNMKEAGWIMQLKLSFLVLPFAIGSLNNFSHKQLKLMVGFLNLCLLIVSAIIYTNYLMHYQLVTEQILQGKPVPNPMNDHIRLSLMTVIAILFNVYILFNQSVFIKFKTEKWLWIGLSVFYVISLHVLSVRSGLLALYVSLIVFIVFYVFHEKKWKLALLTGGLSLLLLAVMFYTSPNLHNKLSYMKWDLAQYKSGVVELSSDSRRMASIKAGVEISLHNLPFGVGVGDVQDEVNAFLSEKFPGLDRENYLAIHNEYLWQLAAAGIPALLALIVLLLAPFFYVYYRKQWLVWCFVAVFALSFMTEHMLEIQRGIAVFLLFFLVMLNYFRQPQIND